MRLEAASRSTVRHGTERGWPSSFRSRRLRFGPPLFLVEVGADQAVREREHDELRPCLQLELPHDVCAMRVDRTDGDEELSADLLVRVAEREELDDLALALRERVECRRRLGDG